MRASMKINARLSKISAPHALLNASRYYLRIIIRDTKRKRLEIQLSKMHWLLGSKSQLSIENKLLIQSNP